MKNRIFFGCIFAVVFSLAPGSAAFGLNLDDIIGTELAAALIAGQKPVLAQFKNPHPKLVPQYDVLRNLVETIRQDLDPSVMVESLHIFRKPPEAEKAAWSFREEAEIYNGALSLSTLAGLQYFSQSRGVIRTLYESSSVIDGPSTKNVLPDPVYSVPQAQLTVFARQKDTTFGDNTYQYDYYTSPGAIIFTQQNLTSFTYGIIPAVGKNKLRSVFAVLDAGNYLLVYAVSMAKAASLPGINTRIGDSFANRAEAIFNWFSDQTDKAFKRAH